MSSSGCRAAVRSACTSSSATTSSRRSTRPTSTRTPLSVRAAFLARQAELEAGAVPAYPYPVAACGFCPWWHVCADKRREEDHISLVANLQRRQGLRIEAEGVHDIPSLAGLDDSVVIPKLSKDTLVNLRSQADLQLRSRGLDAPLHELLEPEHDRGLGRLPAPSPAMSTLTSRATRTGETRDSSTCSAPSTTTGGALRYRPIWAKSRAEGKAALETWIDWIGERLEADPDLHVYHYGAYEPTALKRLVARHTTRELELDELLRRRVFVDLYGITRQAVRAGVESYGLKGIEPSTGSSATRSSPAGSAPSAAGRATSRAVTGSCWTRSACTTAMTA